MANCFQCHKPVCAACVMTNDMGSFCGAACASQYRDFKTHYKPPKLKGTPLVTRLLDLVGVAIVLLGAVHAAHRFLGIKAVAGIDVVGKVLGYGKK